MHSGRHAAASILYRNTIVFMYFDDYVISMAGKHLVDRVIYNFINQVVQTSRVSRANIHTRPFPDSLKAFKHLYGIFVVIKLLFSSQTYKPLSKTNIVFLFFSVTHHLYIRYFL